MELIQEFGLEKLTNDYPTNLSGGERRRVAIARAFVHNPLMVVADEPTSDLDEENTKIILDYFQKQSSLGKSILISTHDLSCLRPGVTHYIMRKGSMKFENHIESLAKNWKKSLPGKFWVEPFCYISLSVIMNGGGEGNWTLSYYIN